MNELIAINEKTIASLFVDKNINEILSSIEKEVLSVTPDTSTVKGRKEIASLANKVAKSKVAIDNAGKNLVHDWKSKSKLVDISRKESRDFLDNLKTKVRLPLTEWEEKERIKKEQELIKAEIELAHYDAIQLNDLFDREKAIEEKERIAAEKEAEILRIKEQERIKTEQAEKERLIKEQAATNARIKAEQEAQAKIDEAERLKAESIAREEHLKLETIEVKVKAEMAAQQAEEDRLKAIEDAKKEKERAIREANEKARIIAEQAEEKRLYDIEQEKEKAALLAKNLKHRKEINNKVLNILISAGIDEKTGKTIIKTILKSNSTAITINY